MLTLEQRNLLDRLKVVDVVDHYSVAVILQSIDPLHAIVVYGLDEIFKALERYENNSD